MNLKITLRTRIVMLVVAAIVPLFGLSIFKAWLSEDAAITRATGNLQIAAALVAANQDRVTSSSFQLLLAIANAPGLLEGKPADCQRYLQALLDPLPVYANLGLIGIDGYFRCDGVGRVASVFAGDRNFFQSALALRTFVAGGYVMSRTTGTPLVTFALPVLDSAGKVKAIVAAGVDVNKISKAVANAPLPTGSRLIIMDRQGIVLAANPEKSAVIGQRVDSPLLQEAVKTMRTGVGEDTDGQGLARIVTFLPSGKPADSPFFVAISADRDTVLAPARKQQWLELLALSLVAFLGGWIAWLMAGRAIVRPAAEILDAMRQVRDGGQDVRIPARLLGGSGEFAGIAAGFKLMAESLRNHHDALEAELVYSLGVQRKLQDARRLGRIGYWQLDLENQLIWWSDEVYELLGVDRATLGSSHEGFMQRIHPGDREAYQACPEAALQDGGPADMELRIVTSAGEVRWMHVVGRTQVASEDEHTSRRTGVIQDITDRKRTELVIARSTEMLNRTGELAQVGGWEVLAETLDTYWSEACYRVHELEPSTGVGLEDAVGFYAPEAQPVMRAALQAAWQEASPWDMELPLLTAKGRRIWVRTQGRAMQQDGKVVRLVGALQDITAQHEVQAHLRLMETCISRLNDMVMVLKVYPDERRTCILFVNDAFTRQMGYSLEEAVGQSTALLHGPKTEGAGLTRIIASIRSGKPVRAELIHYTKSGEQIWVETNLVPLFDSAGGVTEWVSVERNITQRKLAEQALRDSEHRYAALFEDAPVPMWVFDNVTGRFLTVNAAAVQSYGYSTEEFMALKLPDVIPDSEDEYFRQVSRVTELEKNVVAQHSRKDGSLFPVSVVSKPVQYQGSAARFMVALDVSAQVRAEKEVQDYLFTLQRAADATQAITWHHTLQGTMQEVADQARGVIGTHQAVVSFTHGSNWAQAITALSLSEKYAKYRDLTGPMNGAGITTLVCESNRPMRLTQAELEAHPRWRGFGNHADKHPMLRGWLGIPLTGRDGKNIGLLQLSDKYEGEFTLQDEYVATELAQLASIAIENSQLLEEVNLLNAGLEQKVAERTIALARQEALFRALAEQAPQVVWTADPSGSATYCNRAWCELVGGKPEDWTGAQWFSVIHPEDLPDIRTNWETARSGQSEFTGVRRVRDKQGSYHTMAYRASPVLDEQGEVAFWVGIDADITEIKAIEAALRLSNQELEAFSYSVSHDLRSPLNTIDGFSRLLGKQLAGQAGEKVAHYLSRIQAGVAQMGQLIEGLLSLAQVSRMQLHSEPVDLSALARGILDDLQLRHPERQVQVHIESGLQASGDGRLVRAVMENLLANAWKFSSHEAQAEINVGQQLDAAGLPEFFVRDNGAGFDMAYADKLFNPFQRLHLVSEFPGTGIGLATANRVIGRHGGRLWADSAPGCGATFFFTLPKAATVA
ncbi:PAS domain S-box protein [Polaromonas sp.]|uniref:PAS domain S-box protein n=1 Tax=Polaromonas sp. TaxID=1869339 RepID=UPI0017943F0A|nr:PAS domain S-box protein [Polaromonas sp.]NMM04742.1 PAS domain S-box protein [Polaromonas sp.]